MQNQNTRYLIPLLLSFGVASFASAQVTGATNVATTAATAATASLAAQNAASAGAQQASNASRNAAANAATAANTASAAANSARTVAVPSVASSSALNAGSSATVASTTPAAASNVAAQGGLQQAASTHGADVSASVDAGAHHTTTMETPSGLTISSNASQNAVVALDSATVVSKLHSATDETRAAVLQDVDVKLRASQEEVARLNKESRDLRSDARARFKAALQETREREHALRQSIRAARHASKEAALAAQDRVADDYDAYARSLRQLEATASASASGSVAVTGR